MADIVYCLNPACRSVYELSGYVAVRCAACDGVGFFTNIAPDWDALPQPATLAVIACSKQKSGEPSEIPAQHRYTGPLFRAQLAYARSVLALPDSDIYIASAKFGLIGLDTPLPDYNLALYHLSGGERRMWGWRAALALRGRNPQWIHFLAGKMYREAVAHWLPGVEAVNPVAGLGYARQVRYYSAQVSTQAGNV